MTHARCVALALLMGAIWLASVPAQAQYLPPDAYSGPFTTADGTPVASPYGAPMGGEGWYACPPEGNCHDPATGYESWADGGFLRVEYLNWNLKDPGATLLGSSLINVPDPSQEFVVFSPGTVSPLAVTKVPTTGPIGLGNNAGIRVTGGLDLVSGDRFEVGAFLLARSQSGFLLNNFGSRVLLTDPTGLPILTVPATVGNSTLVNGQLSDNVFLYNISFEAQYRSQLWGAEANYILQGDDDGLIHVQPMIGARYINLHERLTQTGVFQDPVVGGPPVITTIDSVTFNNLWGPQLGLRTEVAYSWINAGVDSKLLLLGNTMYGRVSTVNLRSNSDPPVTTTDVFSAFSVGVDLNAFVSVKVASNLWLRLGYNFMYLTAVSRPENNIFYNDNGAAAPPGFVVDQQKQSFFVHGISAGAELKF